MQINPVLRAFKWEDYGDGYMIHFWNQNAFACFEDIVKNVDSEWYVL